MIKESYFLYTATILSTLSFFFFLKYSKKISEYLKIYDIPDNKRKIHLRKTPKTACFSLATLLLMVLIVNNIFAFYPKDLNIIIICSLSIFGIGLIDDQLNLSPYKKIFFISFFLFLSLYFSENLIIEKFYTKTYDFFIDLDHYKIFFTILCILLLINALNLADGINGLAIGIIFFWIFYIIQIYKLSFNFILIIILSNLLLSFYYTFRGRHFLGDNGSLMLGTFAGLIIVYGNNYYIQQSLFPKSAEQILIIFFLPGLDMLRLFIERICKRQNPFKADKNHIHHYLIKKFSLIKSLLLYFVFMNLPIIASLYLNFSLIYIIIMFVIFYCLIIFYLKNYLTT